MDEMGKLTPIIMCGPTGKYGYDRGVAFRITINIR